MLVHTYAILSILFKYFHLIYDFVQNELTMSGECCVEYMHLLPG